MKNMHMNNNYIQITTLFKNYQKVFVAVLKKFKYGHFYKNMLRNEGLQK
jgi:ABC-type maltose transport system permease subunit